MGRQFQLFQPGPVKPVSSLGAKAHRLPTCLQLPRAGKGGWAGCCSLGNPPWGSSLCRNQSWTTLLLLAQSRPGWLVPAKRGGLKGGIVLHAQDPCALHPGRHGPGYRGPASRYLEPLNLFPVQGGSNQLCPGTFSHPMPQTLVSPPAPARPDMRCPCAWRGQGHVWREMPVCPRPLERRG